MKKFFFLSLLLLFLFTSACSTSGPGSNTIVPSSNNISNATTISNAPRNLNIRCYNNDPIGQVIIEKKDLYKNYCENNSKNL